MKKKISLLFALIGWFAVIAQYILMMQNRVTDIGEATIRFFSFFTILTNTLVAVYFTYQVCKGSRQRMPDKPGVLTSITVYITIVGLVYQVVLRWIWSPQGLQMLVDELLHSVIPVCAIIYWYLFEDKKAVQWKKIPLWLIYPIVYLIYIMLRGNASGFYPYPFVDVAKLGAQEVAINSILLTGIFLVVACLFTGVGKWLSK